MRRLVAVAALGVFALVGCGGDDDDDDDDDTDAVLASFDCTAIEQAEGKDSPAARRCWDDWMEQWGDR